MRAASRSKLLPRRDMLNRYQGLEDAANLYFTDKVRRLWWTAGVCALASHLHP